MEANSVDAQEQGSSVVDPGNAGKIVLKVQTPRGLWDEHKPEHAKKRPVYSPMTKVQQVIDDVREVFDFIENDSIYTLHYNGVALEPHRSLKESAIPSGALLVLTVQGGSA